MDEKPKKNQINIELKDDVGQGTYSNLAIITHSTSEFVLDFVRVMPGIPKAEVKSRIILTPEHAKRLLQALGENIVQILMTVRNLTQPEILNLADRATGALKQKTTPTPVGALGLLRAMRDPEVRKGTGVLLELLRSLGRDPEPVQGNTS